MRPFIGVICWQRRSANYLCLERWPKRAIRNCVHLPSWRFLGLKLLFHIQWHWNLFLYCYDESQFLVADWQEWGGEDFTACVTTNILSRHVSAALGWQQLHLLKQYFCGLDVCHIFSLSQGHRLKCVTWRLHSLLISKSFHQWYACFLCYLSPQCFMYFADKGGWRTVVSLAFFLSEKDVILRTIFSARGYILTLW